MPRIALPIPLGFYQSESAPISSQRCINWIPTVAEGGALTQASLMQPSGINQFALSALGACRGAWVVGGVPYFVQGTNLVTVSGAGVISQLGTIQGTVRVSMADNGTQLVIVVPGEVGYVFTAATLTQITDPDFQVSDTVTFYRGYFVFTIRTASNYLYLI